MNKKSTLMLEVCLFLIFVLVSVKIVLNLDDSGYKNRTDLVVQYNLEKDIIPEPIQKKVNPEIITQQVNGVDVTIKKLAKYDITGKVEDMKDYSQSFLASKLSLKSDGEAVIDKISPRDLTLSWGEVALNKNQNAIYCSQNTGGIRYVSLYWKSRNKFI